MAASLPIPVFTNLNDLYQNLGTTLNHAWVYLPNPYPGYFLFMHPSSKRWDNLAQEFKARFGRPPAYIARAPGRVNLIGEHIDYALFGVFPAAIERDILIACAPRPVPSDPSTHAPGSVIAENLHGKYKRQAFTPTRRPTLGPVGKEDVPKDAVHVEEWHLDIDNKDELKWESYVKAGYYGVLNHYFAPNETSLHPIPVDLLVTGSVPAGSGLSSSAAMVVASTLAFLATNGLLEEEAIKNGNLKAITKGSLVEMSMENERRVGVNSGGMDQAASVISTANSALYVSFFPRLSAERIPLPGSSPIGTQYPKSSSTKSAVFVCANSLVVSDKVVHARTRYNLRVVETLAAARILAVRLGLSVGPREKITLRHVLARLIGEPELDADKGEISVDELKSGLERMARELGVTMETMIEWSGMGEEAFKDVYLSWVDVEATHFQLYNRAKHVYTEALRVLQFREVCLTASSYLSPSEEAETAVLGELGKLMNESQESCSRVFDCSCPELDELTRLAMEAGAYGSRLTGAGWGGCTVSLVDETQVDSFIGKVKAAYPPYRDLEGDALHEVIFATKPSSGACVFKFTE
ncbi:hypothetical protein SERLADRAFT_361401 [Serpula lacrymans var. lacrymans S7.9]|uniref:Galactokinase n=1 Tax=Serpula lacrymans var. lacrymans (strain S7.9) TaxID=578457 RepID=F8NVS4_SERL9|nr:uncharacterized protein SERLADRAFT_361401 [Serpula lacrymans var. lacrymans S7.9]EGO24235.1 hypothetical protein SERLADRAFT_361401 [Serpula lacrymans var. lacrymans S7.9]